MINIKEISIGLNKKANQINFGDLQAKNDGSSAELPFTLHFNNEWMMADKVSFTSEEVTAFNGIDFSNDGLTNYALQKLGLEKL